MIRLLIVDDHPIVRDGLHGILAAEPDLEVVGEAADGAEALRLVRELAVDVVLMDLRMPVMGGVEAITALRAEAPDVRVLVLTTYDSDRDVLPAIAAGATGYLLKDAMPPDFLAAIHALRAGESPISPSLARHLLKRYHQATEPADALAAADDEGEGLTAREIDILQRIAAGASVAEIAQRLFISTHTVKTHVKNIYRKLEAHSRIEAVNIAHRRHLIGP